MKNITFFRFCTLILLFVFSVSFTYAQDNDDDDDALDLRRERRKNLVIKEYNSDPKGKVQWLDHVRTYNERGLKIEDVEYTRYGLKEKVVYKYDKNDLCTQQVVYDEKGKVKLIKKFEYNNDRTKKKQYNYLPNGRLFTSKDFQYTR